MLENMGFLPPKRNSFSVSFTHLNWSDGYFLTLGKKHSSSGNNWKPRNKSWFWRVSPFLFRHSFISCLKQPAKDDKWMEMREKSKWPTTSSLPTHTNLIPHKRNRKDRQILAKVDMPLEEKQYQIRLCCAFICVTFKLYTMCVSVQRVSAPTISILQGGTIKLSS